MPSATNGLAVAPSSGASRYRAAAGVIGVIAVFTIIASVGAFAGGAQQWIEFGAGIAALGLASLAAGRYVSGLVESPGVDTRSQMPESLRAAA